MSSQSAAPVHLSAAELHEARQEQYFVATQWQLMWRKFKRHHLAVVGGAVLALFYVAGLFPEFFSPSVPWERVRQLAYSPPQRIRFIHEGRIRAPFVYGLRQSIDPLTLQKLYTVDREQVTPLRLLVRGAEYRVWGLIPGSLHLFGSNAGPVMLLGADSFGRDVLTRNLYAARVSLSVGLVGVVLSFLLGLVLGGISGYYGGTIDNIIQRVIDFLISLPTIPVWMGLAAALPPEWGSIKVYFAVTLILSIVGWTGLARVVRGKLLELREADFVMAARVSGARQRRVIVAHLIPSFMSYLIVHLTLAIPRMILGETALSFLGMGIRPPAVSWGTLLQDAQNIQTVVLYPWLMFPALFVVGAVLMFNFLGDGLRDAADPYK